MAVTLHELIGQLQQSGPHVTSFLPFSADMIMAAAQPTPLSTSMARAGQLRAQAPHSMHASYRTRTAFLFSRAKTLWGQTLAHMPQPTHRFGSYRRVFNGSPAPSQGTLFGGTRSTGSHHHDLVAHQNHPRASSRRNVVRTTPVTNVTAMSGMYRNISFRTPVLEVRVEDPVKLSAR